MKKIFTLFSFIVILASSQAQLANQGFETWENPMLSNSFSATGAFAGVTFYICAPSFTYNELEDWSSTNQITNTPNLGSTELVSQSATANSGSSSVQIESKEISLTGYLAPGCTGFSQSLDNVAPGLIVNGSFDIEVQEMIDNILGGTGLNALNPFTYPGVGQEIDFIPKTISGYYQYTGANDGTTQDSCIIVSGLKKNGELIGHVVQRFGNASTWTQFSLDYTHLNCEVPDTIVTIISSSSIDLEIVNNDFIINSNFTGVDGSIMLVDDIHIDTIDLADFPPILMPDADVILTIDSSTVDVLANDEFCDMATYAPIILTNPSNGTVSINASNEAVYTPDSTFTGTDVYTYYICNTSMLCDTTTVTITVDPIAICYANDDVRTLDISESTTDNFDPRSNDVDCGTSISILGSGPANGGAVVESNNSITYSPNTNFTGIDEFDYFICNTINTSQCDTASIKYIVENDSTTSINEIPGTLISMYPNPSSNKLYISLDLDSEISYSIYNTVGEKISQSTFIRRTEIDINAFNNGLYFIEMSTDGKKSVRKFQVIK